MFLQESSIFYFISNIQLMGAFTYGKEHEYCEENRHKKNGC